MKQYVLSNWDKYNMVNSKEEMIVLLNILEAHNESFDAIHNVAIGESQWTCSILFMSNPSTEREVVEGIKDHNIFYRDYNTLIEIERDNAEFYGYTMDEYLDLISDDIKKTSDGYVRILQH